MGDATELDIEHGGSRVAKDLFSGAVGGIAQVLIGMSVFNFLPCFYISNSLCSLRANLSSDTCFRNLHPVEPASLEEPSN